MSCERIVSFDIARAISMIWIVCFWHASDYLDSVDFNPWGNYLTIASLSVFFYLSGYLLSIRYYIRSIDDVCRFIKKRFIRLYPLYFLALCGFLLLHMVSKRSFLLALLGLTTFIRPQIQTLWFIEMLLLFYLLFIIVSRMKPWLIVVFSLFLWVAIASIISLFRCIDTRVLVYLPVFMFGVWEARCNVVGKCGCVSCLVVFIVLSIVDYYVCPCANVFSLSIIRSLLGLSGAVLIVRISDYVDNKYIKSICSIVAYSSMSAYLFHRHIYSLCFKTYGLIESKIPFLSSFQASRILYLYIVIVPIILVVGYCLQSQYDRGGAYSSA